MTGGLGKRVNFLESQIVNSPIPLQIGNLNMLRTMKVKVCGPAVMAVMVMVFGMATEIALAQAQPPAVQAPNLQAVDNGVTLDLAVRDRHNKPVLDLRPEEISITDNGAAVKVNDLRLVNGKQADEPLITLLFDRPGMQNNRKGSEDAMFGESPLAARRESKKLHDAAAKVMRGFPGTGIQFAVLDVWGRLQIQRQYTGDRKAISQAISDAVKPEIYGSKVAANEEEKRLIQLAKTGQGSAGASSGTRERTLARAMYAALQASSHIASDQHLSLSLACLLALVEAQESLPGRKAILYFPLTNESNDDSRNWQSQDSHAKDAIRSIVGAANRAGASIYVVLPDEVEDTDQLAGIYSTAGLGMSLQASSVDITGAGSPYMGDTTALAMAAMATKKPSAIASQDNLNRLARQTGGDVLNAGGSVSGSIKELIQGLTTYYAASFASTSDVQDGSFHSTAFKTTRRGLRMRARAGYLALPPSAGITQPPQPFELPLLAVLKRPERPAEIDYRAGVLRMGHRDEDSVALLALEVPVSELQVREDASTHLNAAHVSVLATINDSSGTVIERFSEDIARRWAAGSSAGSAPAYVSFERSFSAPPGKYSLETAVIDSNSGKAAARSQSFEISASQEMPELTELLLVRGIEPTTNSESEPDLLWRGEQRVQPNMYGKLPAGVHSAQVFFFAHTDPKSQDAAAIKLEVLRDGVPLKGEPLTSTVKAGNEFESVLKGFAISAATDGEYEVRVTLTQGGKSAQAIGKFALTGEEERGASGGSGDAPLTVDPPGLADSGQADDRPAPEVINGVLADATKNALDYGTVLPNLICQQTTRRLRDERHNGNWQLRDKLVEVLTYVNHQESRTVVAGEVNNQKKDEKTMSEIGMISTGEFGMALNNVFNPDSKALFTWKQTGMLRGEPAEIFDYRIAQESSKFALTVPNASIKVGYHGRVYVDRATHGVRSITIITDDVPKKFPIHKAAIRIDYDYIAINEHDYMLPVSAQVVAERSGNLLERNDLEFSNFRKFGSNARIIGADPESEQQ